MTSTAYSSALIGVFLLCLAVGWYLSTRVLRFLLARSIMDIPNERSSHQAPTPRGGGWAVMLTVVPVFAIAGLAFGRHKMAPQISPKKTWEGAAGGVLVSMAVGALVAWLARDYFPAWLTPAVAALLALPLAIVAIVSDLIESIIKRRAAHKDSGAVIPGIGGMFDVSDSLLLTAPLGFFLFRLF